MKEINESVFFIITRFMFNKYRASILIGIIIPMLKRTEKMLHNGRRLWPVPQLPPTVQHFFCS